MSAFDRLPIGGEHTPAARGAYGEDRFVFDFCACCGVFTYLQWRRRECDGCFYGRPPVGSGVAA